MLYLNATVRNDIVSSMPRNNRSFTYPSVSLGFIFTELEALKNDVLTYGKIRASYAEVGTGRYLLSFLNYYEHRLTAVVSISGTPIHIPYQGSIAYTPILQDL